MNYGRTCISYATFKGLLHEYVVNVKQLLQQARLLEGQGGEGCGLGAEDKGGYVKSFI